MENNTNFDDLLRSKLGGESFEPSSSDWGDALALLEEEEDDRKGFFWLLYGLGGLAILFTTILFVYSLNSNNNDQISQNASSNTNGTINSLNHNTIHSNSNNDRLSNSSINDNQTFIDGDYLTSVKSLTEYNTSSEASTSSILNNMISTDYGNQSDFYNKIWSTNDLASTNQLSSASIIFSNGLNGSTLNAQYDSYLKTIKNLNGVLDSLDKENENFAIIDLGEAGLIAGLIEELITVDGDTINLDSLEEASQDTMAKDSLDPIPPVEKTSKKNGKSKNPILYVYGKGLLGSDRIVGIGLGASRKIFGPLSIHLNGGYTLHKTDYKALDTVKNYSFGSAESPTEFKINSMHAINGAVKLNYQISEKHHAGISGHYYYLLNQKGSFQEEAAETLKGNFVEVADSYISIGGNYTYYLLNNLAIEALYEYGIQKEVFEGTENQHYFGIGVRYDLF